MAFDGRSCDAPLIVGVDGSGPSLRATDWAADEAVLRGAPLRLVYASMWEHYEGEGLAADYGKPFEKLRGEHIVEAAARRARERRPELEVTAEALPDGPVTVLPEESRRACALVVGTRGRSGVAEALLGSVSLAVAARAHCPVIVVRGGHDNQAKAGIHQCVLLGVGADTKGSAAVRFAYHEARIRGVPLEAVRAWRRPAHENTDHPLLSGTTTRPHEEQAVRVLEAALEGAPAELDLRRRTAEGHAHRVLEDASHHADLLVLGARRRHGHLGLRLGRVTHVVLHHSACPVAVVPQRD
ncbi:universal stress protein [Streptomyces sp. S.PB5]|uniref:universal stress protein n=1 Tax=Streptomyces sp. S.PB5 TaxID=3020844 RepID=UPI0025B27D21|nr:universal stress protein [Streptomyces sp. S.PB5]MDN3027954.1 universal stress protein [Streptomyces sp. S.PB5]